jgi:hypothetical protein
MDQLRLVRLITSDARATRLALTTLYAHQTADEQSSGLTRHRNAMGFNATDAEFLSSLARQCEAGHRLTSRQLTAARRLLPKYARQLLAGAVNWDELAGGEMRSMEALAAELLANREAEVATPKQS